MGRKPDWIFDGHWTCEPNADGTLPETNKQRWKCNYCTVSMTRKSNRLRKHMLDCPNCPEEIKAKVDEFNRSGRGRHRAKRRHGSGESSSSDDDDLETTLSPLKKMRASELISQMLGLTPEVGTSSKGPKKHISKYTDEDFKREERELNLKKLRAEVECVELKNEMMKRLIPLSDKLSEAVHIYVEEKMSGRTVINIEQDANGEVATTAIHSYQVHNPEQA